MTTSAHPHIDEIADDLVVVDRLIVVARISTAITAMLCAAAIVLGVLLVDGARARQPASVHDAL